MWPRFSFWGFNQNWKYLKLQSFVIALKMPDTSDEALRFIESPFLAHAVFSCTHHNVHNLSDQTEMRTLLYLLKNMTCVSHSHVDTRKLIISRRKIEYFLVVYSKGNIFCIDNVILIVRRWRKWGADVDADVAGGWWGCNYGWGKTRLLMVNEVKWRRCRLGCYFQWGLCMGDTGMFFCRRWGSGNTHVTPWLEHTHTSHTHNSHTYAQYVT